jgi:hypothetical protein
LSGSRHLLAVHLTNQKHLISLLHQLALWPGFGADQ